MLNDKERIKELMIQKALHRMQSRFGNAMHHSRVPSLVAENNHDKFVKFKIGETSNISKGHILSSISSLISNHDSTEGHQEIPTPDWFQNSDPVDVSIIIPLYKSESVLSDLISSFSIKKQKYSWEIIFVDDFCPQNSKSKIVNLWAEKIGKTKVGKIISNFRNKGYGYSCNIGANAANGKHFIFLNSDTKVTDGWIDPIVDLLQNPSVGIVGNLHLKDGGPYHGRIDSFGSQWTWEHRTFAHVGRDIYNLKRINQPFSLDDAPEEFKNVQEREMVTGCCFGIRKDLFDHIGGFNPNYKIGYWEDTEMCLAVKELGYKILVTPESKIYHKSGHSKSHNHHYLNKNISFFNNKWIQSGRIDDLVEDKRPQKPNVKSILLMRIASAGDVLMATSVASALKKKHPDCKISFLTNFKNLIENNPFIDNVIDAKTKVCSNSKISLNFNVFYNLDYTYEFRKETNILDVFSECVGVKKEDCDLYIHQEKLKIDLPEKYVVIHAGNSNWIGRTYKKEYFQEICKKFKERNITTVCVGSHNDFVLDCDYNLVNQTIVSELAWVIANAKLFVGIDSFPMHVAQTVGTKGICFFGAVKPECFIVNDKIIPVVAPNVSCLGCHHRNHLPRVTNKVCQTINENCVNNCSPDYFWQAIEKHLGA